MCVCTRFPSGSSAASVRYGGIDSVGRAPHVCVTVESTLWAERRILALRWNRFYGPSATYMRYGGIVSVDRAPHICVGLPEQNVFYQMALLFYVPFKRLVPYISISLSEVKL
ncbi:hypothetical protein AVEN_151052-1 [Araneus ventricosus]|uniref:Uncharacterized protein n=1 Tax=Araneus ventricosus TaxID=182803 RepID=A0A4Y2WPJ4_ARAVE|nr:hypothetical protein AVEN_151052-1 [Araneus ventricosus]